MSNTLSTAKRERVLGLYARQIKVHVEAAEQAYAKTVESMIAVGERLIKARALVPEGGLDAWAKKAVGMNPKTVRTYVRFALHAEILRQHQPNGTLAARKLLTELAVPRLNSAEVTAERAQTLKKEGLTNKAIGEQLGVSGARISQLLNKDTARAKNAAAQRRRLKAQKALEREEQAARVRKSGNKNASEAYSLVRKALQELDRAMSETPVAKQKYLRMAQDEMYRAQDNIALALNT